MEKAEPDKTFERLLRFFRSHYLRPVEKAVMTDERMRECAHEFGLVNVDRVADLETALRAIMERVDFVADERTHAVATNAEIDIYELAKEALNGGRSA